MDMEFIARLKEARRIIAENPGLTSTELHKRFGVDVKDIGYLAHRSLIRMERRDKRAHWHVRPGVSNCRGVRVECDDQPIYKPEPQSKPEYAKPTFARALPPVDRELMGEFEENDKGSGYWNEFLTEHVPTWER